MGRPSRIHDGRLVERLRLHMAERGYTLSEVANAVGFDKSTLSRSLSKGAFSRSLRGAVAELLGEDGEADTTAKLLLKSLRLLSLSDRMRQDAERMIAEALDRTAKNK